MSGSRANMIGRRSMVKGLGTAACLGALGLPRSASAAETIKLGTLYPKASPWGQVLTTWTKAVLEKSGGALALQIFYNGQQGDEAAMVAKMKSGQLDAAAVTAVGLGKIYKPILALQMPGLFTTWARLDAARDAMKGEFENGAKDAGFLIAGWNDVGLARIFSRGFAVKLPDDLRGKKPLLWRDDPLAPIFFQVLGGVTPVPLNIPEVLPNLNTGAINALWSPSLLAEQLQWSSKLDTLTDMIFAVTIGGLVFSSKRIDALPADLKTVLTDTAKVATAALTKRIRNEDDAAFGRLKGKTTINTLSADEQGKWDGVFKQVRQRLAQGTFSPDLVAKLEGLAK